MYAGPLLAPLGGEAVEMPVDAAVAAGMHAMNLSTWRQTARDRQLGGEEQLDQLAASLDDLSGRPGTATVRWLLHQVVLSR